MTRSARRILTGAIAAAAVLPCLIARWPPLYDYYHWVFHGHVLAKLLSAGPGDTLAKSFSIDARPIPNLAISLGMTFLNYFMSAPLAGRVFLAGTVLLFGFGFLVLVRTIQERPTAVELLGFAWAYGYFAHAGYLGYLSSMGLAFLAIAYIHHLSRLESAVKPRQIAGLGAHIALVWCGHVSAWLVLSGALFIHVAGAALRRSWLRSLSLAVAIVPSLVLVAWYAAPRMHRVVGPEAETSVYGSSVDKWVSLVDPTLLFLRSDPLPPIAPVFWTNLIGMALLATAAFAGFAPAAERSVPGRHLNTLRLVAALLGLFALAWPFSSFAGMGRAEERLLLPAFLIALATLPLRQAGARLTAFAGTVVLAVLVLHAAEFRASSRRIEGVLTVLREKIPAGQGYLSIALWEGRRDGGCDQASGLPTLGQATLKWIALMNAIETDRLHVRVQGSGILEYEEDWADIWVYINKPEEVPNMFGPPGTDPRIPYIVVLGCDAGRKVAEDAYAPFYTTVANEGSISVFRHR